MTKGSLLSSAFVGVLATGIAFQFGPGSGGALAQKAETPADKTVKVSGPNASAPAVKTTASSSAAFARPAAENARLRGSMTWGFGGRSHTGWALYSDLIANTVGTDARPNTAEFAMAVADWQKRSGMPATGIVDQTTLQAFVKFWQSERLGKSIYPGDDRLVLAPSTEFWDNSRGEELRKLEKETYDAYKKMVAAAVKDLGKDLKLTANGELAPEEKFFRIVSAYRSREYQEQLRRQQPGAGRAALAKHSPHYTGQALDIYVGGEPVTTKDANRAIQVETPAYKWLVKNARRFGFVPYFYEPWHWEYVGTGR